MNRRSAQLVLALLVAGCLGCLGCAGGDVEPPDDSGAPPSTRPAEPMTSRPALAPRQILIGGRVVEVEVASTEATRGRGLSGRESLEPDTGMIFLYPMSRPRRFWMKGCLIGLDIAYLDEAQRIFQIGSVDPPAGPHVSDHDMPRLPSIAPAMYVVEMRKGWFAEKGIVPGARVEFSESIAARARAIAWPSTPEER